jgi:hypothetical protein
VPANRQPAPAIAPLAVGTRLPLFFWGENTPQKKELRLSASHLGFLQKPVAIALHNYIPFFLFANLVIIIN